MITSCIIENNIRFEVKLEISIAYIIYLRNKCSQTRNEFQDTVVDIDQAVLIPPWQLAPRPTTVVVVYTHHRHRLPPTSLNTLPGRAWLKLTQKGAKRADRDLFFASRGADDGTVLLVDWLIGWLVSWLLVSWLWVVVVVVVVTNSNYPVSRVNFQGCCFHGNYLLCASCDCVSGPYILKCQPQYSDCPDAWDKIA